MHPDTLPLGAAVTPSCFTGDVAPVAVRIGRPLILGERWISWEAASAGVLVCGVLGVLLGVVGSRAGGVLTKNRRGARSHQD